MGYKLISISVILMAVLLVEIGSEKAEAFDRQRNRSSQPSGYPGGQQAACNVVPYTAYVAPPVGCLPPLGGFQCYYQNSGYQTQAYKGCITKLP